MKKIFIFIILIIACFSWYLIDFPIPIKNKQGEYVVLLHGIKRTGLSMIKMQNNLSEAGFMPINITYPSTEYTIEENADFIHTKLKDFNLDKDRKINFVTHSMGGLVAHKYINKYQPKNLGRVVMLSPPNQGSESADTYKDWWFHQKMLGPALQEMGTDRTPLAVNFELGIITGDRTLAPIASFLTIEGKDDGRVSVPNSKIKGMKDHIVVHATHTFIMKNNEVIKQTINFLKQGKFYE